MTPNVTAINDLINKRFSGNKSAFSEALGINRSQISIMINHKGRSVGSLFYGALIAYCDQEDLDFRDFIFLPETVTKVTTKVVRKGG